MVTSISGFGVPAWLMMVAALAVWVVLLRGVTRLLLRSRGRIECPLSGREASVVIVRGPDGSIEDVERCSLLEAGAPVKCEKECVHLAH